MRRVVLGLPFAIACAHAPAPVAARDAPALPANQTRHYTIWLGGARVGTATETEVWSARGLRFEREEIMHFLRGESEVELATTIDIDADLGLVPSRVRWIERSREVHAEEAIRVEGHWQTSTGARLPDDAVPAELLPLIVRRDGAFAGAVFLPARDFVAGAGRIDPVAPGRMAARLELAGGSLAIATIDLDRDGTPERVVDGEGVIAIRASATQASAPYPAVDLIAATAVPISGGVRHGRALHLDGDLALPPVPGQLARPTADGIVVQLGVHWPGDLPPGPPGPDRGREITALVAEIRHRIAPDLGAGPADTRDAAATAGDCTTYALAFAALATSHAIPTRVVTGLRLDGDRLVRHRWAVSWTGRAWIAVDAAFGAAPAGGELVGLAIHDADDAGLVSGEAALTHVRGASWE